VSNFQTVGFNSTSNVGSTTSIGRPKVNVSFAWQANAGITIKPKGSRLSLDLFYRYYNGGEFKGPSSIVLNTSSGSGDFSAAQKPWTGHLKTNQFCGELRMNI